MTEYFKDKARIDAMKEVNYKSAQWRVNIRNEVFEMLDIFHTLAEKHGLKYSIINGTLLGAVKFEGIIPWDDDADILILNDDVPILLELLKELPYDSKETFYGFLCTGKKSFALMDFIIYDIDPLNRDNYEMCYPVIDGKKTFWSRMVKQAKINKNSLFPLRLYKYDHLTLWGPNDGKDICLNLYNKKVFDENRRPDGGYGFHPIVPYTIPQITTIGKALLTPLVRKMPEVMIDKILNLKR